MTANKLAIEQAIRLLEENPNSTSAQTQLGYAYSCAKQNDKAREHFFKAIDIDSNNIYAYLGLGQVAHGRDEAIRFFAKAISIDPNNVEANLLLGRTYRKFQENDKAIKYLKNALSINDRNVDGWIDIGICYFYTKDINAAIECMVKAIDLDPKAYRAYSNLIQYYYRTGKYSEAIEHGKKAIELDPHQWRAYFNVSYCYSYIGSYDEAIKALSEAIRLNPTYMHAYYQLGNVYIAIGNYKEAQEAFQRAIDIDSGFEPAHKGLAGIYLDMGQPEEAVKEFRKTRFSKISIKTPDDTFAFEAGKINLANRTYLHIESLRNMAVYFNCINHKDAQGYANLLIVLHDILVDKKFTDSIELTDDIAVNVTHLLFDIISNNNKDLAAKRKSYLYLKKMLDARFGNAVLQLISNRWNEIEKYLESYLPVLPRLDVSVITAINIIYQENGVLRLSIKNKGYLPAHNVLIEVQPSNEFYAESPELSISTINDSSEVDLKLYVYTQGIFSITIKCSFDGGLDIIQTFKYNAFRKNPYFYGRPVKDPDMFFGREQLLENILSRIKNVAKQDILIHGIRRIGKTSLLYQILNRLELPFIPVYFSLQQIGAVDDTSVLRQLIYEVCEAVSKLSQYTSKELHKRKIPSNIDKVNESTAFDIVSRAFRKDLEALLAFTKELAPGFRIVILLDEGDLLFQLGVHMQRFMRDLLQRYDQVVMVLAGSPKIIELSASSYDSPFYNNFAHENLVGLDFADALHLIIAPMETLGITCSLEIAKKIYNFCGGMTFYIQAVCFHLLDEVYRNKITECSDNELEIAKEKIYAELRKSFDAIWHEFDDVQKELLLYLSRTDDLILKSDPELKKWSDQVPILLEYSTITISDEIVSIRAGLIKRWIKEKC